MMSRERKALGKLVFWLVLGAVAGIFLAAVLSCHEYRTIAELTGAVLRQEDLIQEAEEERAIRMDDAENKERPAILPYVPGRGGEDPYGILAKGLKGSSEKFRQEGEEFLGVYGYRPLRKWGEYLPFTVGICVVLFLAAGLVLFEIRYREEAYEKRRVRELTEYLRAVNQGEGAVLCRNEDMFSHLEDEIYKTVMELRSTEEKAVKDHEILADRIADIAHQLKTPLTSMSLMTELLKEYQTCETREYYDRLSNQVERLKNLVSGLLSLAKLDSHGIVFKREKLELSELIESAAEPLEAVMEEKQIILVSGEKSAAEDRKHGPEYLCEAGTFIYADPQWTEEALMNILKNCAEHTPAGGRIKVAYSQNPIYTELRIEDGGSGFEKKDLPHIFERFYRGAEAAKDNAGIGLSLAKAVLEQQNGEISAQNTADGHACFRIKWY